MLFDLVGHSEKSEKPDFLEKQAEISFLANVKSDHI